MAMRKAQRQKAKARVGISGPAGAGKTFSALLMAYGITSSWEDVCLIDTENHSGDLYADYHKNGIDIGEYNIIDLSAPYTPDKYIAGIKECERSGIKVIVIDSMTHAWAGEGGLLDKKGQIEKKQGENSWTAWRSITPLHNQLVETILQSPCHVIVTLRAKMDHVQEKDEATGRVVVKKIGMNPIQRDGMEYEFTVFFDIDQNHQASCTKDRTSIFDGRVWTPGIETGRLLLEWLETGVDAPKNMNDIQKAKITDLAKAKFADGRSFNDYCKKTYHKQFSQLTETEADEVIAYLQPEPKQEQPDDSTGLFGKLSDRTMKKLHAAAKEAGMDHDALHNFAYLETGVKSLSDLNEEEAERVLSSIRDFKEQQAAAQ